MNEGHEVIPELKPSDVQEFCFLSFTTELITMLTSLIGTSSYLQVTNLRALYNIWRGRCSNYTFRRVCYVSDSMANGNNILSGVEVHFVITTFKWHKKSSPYYIISLGKRSCIVLATVDTFIRLAFSAFCSGTVYWLLGTACVVANWHGTWGKYTRKDSDLCCLYREPRRYRCSPTTEPDARKRCDTGGCGDARHCLVLYCPRL